MAIGARKMVRRSSGTAYAKEAAQIVSKALARHYPTQTQHADDWASRDTRQQAGLLAYWRSGVRPEQRLSRRTHA